MEVGSHRPVVQRIHLMPVDNPLALHNLQAKVKVRFGIKFYLSSLEDFLPVVVVLDNRQDIHLVDRLENRLVGLAGLDSLLVPVLDNRLDSPRMKFNYFLVITCTVSII